MHDFASLILPPELKEGFYESWKKDVELWKGLKTCSAAEQGPILFRSLKGNARKAANELTVAQIQSENGLELILGKIDKVTLLETNLNICVLLERFESMKRPPNMTISNFILDFESLHSKVAGLGCTYPDGVLAYRLMKSANISADHESLCRATVATGAWSYKSVSDQLKKIFPELTATTSSEPPKFIDRPIKVEVQDTYFAENAPEQDYPMLADMMIIIPFSMRILLIKTTTTTLRI